MANSFLQSSTGGLDVWRIHEFADDAESDDEERTQELRSEFVAEFERVEAELARHFGAPLRKGFEDDPAIPLNGVFCFAVWEVDERVLFVAASHEDRGTPMLLMIGTDESGNR